MKYSILGIIFFVSTSCLLSQEKSTRSFSFEPFIGTGLSLARFQSQKYGDQGNRPVPSTISISKERLFLTGGYVKYRLSPRVQLKTGFLFYKDRFDFTLDGLVFGTDIDPNGGGYVTTSSLDAKIDRHHFSIPLLVDFYLKEDTYHLIGGVAGIQTIRNRFELIVTRFGNGDVEYGNGPDNSKVSARFLNGTLGFGRKFCFEKPHPALLIRILSHYLFSLNRFDISEKGKHNITFVLEVGYEF